MGRWQRFISRIFTPTTDLVATVDASEEGDALTVTLAIPSEADPTTTVAVLALDAAHGRVRTSEGQHKLSDEAQRVIAAIAPALPDEGWRRTKRTSAITVAEAQIPETLRALRAIADAAPPSVADVVVGDAAPPPPQVRESANARAIKLAEKRALQYEFGVDFDGADALTVQTHVVSADGRVRLRPDEIAAPPPPTPVKGRRGKAIPVAEPTGPRWVRQGKTYYMAPSEVAPDVQMFTSERLALRGDAIPFFLAKQIKQLNKAGKVVTSDEVKAARVESAPLEPVSVLDMDAEGWLAVDVAYRGAGQQFSQADVADLPPDTRYIRRGNVWIPIDRKADRKLHDAIDDVERKLGARRDDHGRLRVAPGQGDEARRTLLDTAEIDESAAFQKFLADLAGFKKIEPVKPPKGLTGTLREYQVEGYRWLAFLRRYFLNGVLADDMGLGKTISVLALLQYGKEHPDAEHPDPTLVVCPTSCADNWIDEAAKFTPGLRVVRYIGPDRERLLDDPPDVLVTTYETLRRDMGYLQRQSWDYVILDEAQKIKNPITDTARACRQLLTRHRLAVTGTPIENRLDELWALFDFLMPGYLGSQARFRRDYEGPIMREKSGSVSDELKRKIAPFMLRRMKEQVAKDLPPKIYVARECKLTREQSQEYARIAGEGRERVLEQARGGNVVLTMSLLASLTQLKQICCHPALLTDGVASQELHGRSGKFELFKEELAERLDAGDKILVFSQYAEMCKIIERYLKESGIPSLYLDGQTRNRQELVRTFQSDPNIKVFVLSLRAAGFGITLTAASTVIHYDRWWNPAVENQATDRAYRIGQQRTVQVVQFRTVDTIEEKIDKLLTTKTELFDDVIESDEQAKTVTRQELLDLFAYSPLSDGATLEGMPVIAPVGAAS